MRVAVLTANLGKFDDNFDSYPQDLPKDVEMAFFRFTDDNFPPIAGLTPRLQYRIPKLFGWEMFPGFDVYIWLDGSMSMQDPNSVAWFLNKLHGHDAVFFKHPWRKTIAEEVAHIEQKLQEKNQYITSRYANGLHKEQLKEIQADPNFQDDELYASTVFVYKNTPKVRQALKSWWAAQSRYFTCDQVVLPYIIKKHYLKVIGLRKDLFNNPFVTLTSKHK